MGKCKKRTLYKTNTFCNSTSFMTREEAVNDIFRLFNKTKQRSENSNFKKAVDIISLFGISAEELSEAGVAYENLKALESVLV